MRAGHQLLRERAVALLDERWDGGLVVIVGGPGLGKSTLLDQARVESATLGRGVEFVVRGRPGWTSASLHKALLREISEHVGSTMPTTDGTEYSDGTDPTVITERLWALAPQRVGLIVDDLHALEESGLTYLLELRVGLPTNAHLVVATRETAHLSAMLMTADPTIVLDDGDLLFDAHELEQFAHATGVDVQRLHRAGGWPAVLALTASVGSDVADAYLYQKVLGELTETQQGDLAIASFIGGLDATAALAVLEGRTSDYVSIPLVELPASGGIVVHDLWSEALEGAVKPERLAEAVRTAASLAEQSGDVERAVALLTKAGLHHDVRGAMVRHLVKGPDRIPVTLLDRWLREIRNPEQALLRRLLQQLRKGLIHGAIDTIEFAALRDRFHKANELDLEAIALEIFFAAAWSADDVNRCLEIAERLIELHDAGVEVAAHAPFTLAITSARSEGDSERVLELIAEMRDRSATEPGVDRMLTLELETLVSLGRPFVALGRLEELESLMSERKLRSVTYGLTYWFCGMADEAIASLDGLLDQQGRFVGIERSWLATSDMFRSWRGLPLTNHERTPLDGHTDPFSIYSALVEGLCGVAEHINASDEAAAEAELLDLKSRLPPDSGFALQAWFMGVAAWYTLIPDDRPMLDGFMTADLFGETQSLLASFVALRDGVVPTNSEIALLPTPEQIGILLPVVWSVEFAARMAETDLALALSVLACLPNGGRTALHQLAATAKGDVQDGAVSLLDARPLEPGMQLRVQLFGPPVLENGSDEEPKNWRRGRVRALLGFLATRGRVPRETVIDALWPSLSLDAGRKNLRVTLSYLTKALEPERKPNSQSWFIESSGESLALNAEGLNFDVLIVEEQLRLADTYQSQGLASMAIDALRIACQNYRGPILEGLDDEWILELRSFTDRRVTRACLRLAALLDAGRSNEAATWARRAIEIEPYNIEAHEMLLSVVGTNDDERHQVQDKLNALLN